MQMKFSVDDVIYKTHFYMKPCWLGLEHALSPAEG